MTDMNSPEAEAPSRGSDAPELDSSTLAPQHYPLAEGLQVRNLVGRIISDLIQS